MTDESDSPKSRHDISASSTPPAIPFVPNDIRLPTPDVAFLSVTAQSERGISESMTSGRKRSATRTFRHRDTIGHPHRTREASNQGQRRGFDFLLLNPNANVVESRMVTTGHILRPRPRRPGPNGTCRRHDQELTCFQSSQPMRSQVEADEDTLIRKTRSAFCHHFNETASIAGDEIGLESKPLDVYVQVGKSRCSPLPCVDLLDLVDEESPITLPMKPMPPNLNILSAVTGGSTIRWADGMAPPPTKPDPQWGALLTLSSNVEPTLTPVELHSHF